jgi:hypothetical protein
MTTTNRIAKRNGFAKKTEGTFRVKGNDNVVVKVKKSRTKDEIINDAIPADYLYIDENDMNTIIHNVLCFGEDVIFGYEIRIWEVEMLIAICDEIHGIELNVGYTRFSDASSFVNFSAKLSD